MTCTRVSLHNHRCRNHGASAPLYTPSLCFFQGFHCEDHENPADFLLDTLNRSERKHDAVDAVLCSAQGICPIHAHLTHSSHQDTEIFLEGFEAML